MSSSNPPQFTSTKEFEAWISKFTDLFRSKESEQNWEQRDTLLQELQSVFRVNGGKWNDVWVGSLRPIAVEAIRGSIQSLRTTLALTALATLSDLYIYTSPSSPLEQPLSPPDTLSTETLIHTLIKLLSLTKKLVVNAAQFTLTTLVERGVYSNKWPQLFAAFYADKSATVRLGCVSVFTTLLSKRYSSLSLGDKSILVDTAINMVKKALSDANPQVRQLARDLYAALEQCDPARTAELERGLDHSVRKGLLRAGSAGSNSIHSATVTGRSVSSLSTSSGTNPNDKDKTKRKVTLKELKIQVKEEQESSRVNTPTAVLSASSTTSSPSSAKTPTSLQKQRKQSSPVRTSRSSSDTPTPRSAVAKVEKYEDVEIYMPRRSSAPQQRVSENTSGSVNASPRRQSSGSNSNSNSKSGSPIKDRERRSINASPKRTPQRQNTEQLKQLEKDYLADEFEQHDEELDVEEEAIIETPRASKVERVAKVVDENPFVVPSYQQEPSFAMGDLSKETIPDAFDEMNTMLNISMLQNQSFTYTNQAQPISQPKQSSQMRNERNTSISTMEMNALTNTPPANDYAEKNVWTVKKQYQWARSGKSKLNEGTPTPSRPSREEHILLLPELLHKISRGSADKSVFRKLMRISRENPVMEEDGEEVIDGSYDLWEQWFSDVLKTVLHCVAISDDKIVRTHALLVILRLLENQRPFFDGSEKTLIYNVLRFRSTGVDEVQANLEKVADTAILTLNRTALVTSLLQYLQEFDYGVVPDPLYTHHATDDRGYVDGYRYSPHPAASAFTMLGRVFRKRFSMRRPYTDPFMSNSGTSKELMQLIPPIVPAITKGMNSSDAGIRKGAVDAIMGLYYILREDIWQHLQGVLTPAQQKLVSVWVDKFKDDLEVAC